MEFMSDLESSNGEETMETSTASTLTSNTSNSSSNEDECDGQNKAARKLKSRNKSKTNLLNISATSSHLTSPNRHKLPKSNRCIKSASNLKNQSAQKIKEKDSFWDSLDATIDSVARNFGTPGAHNNAAANINHSLGENANGDVVMSSPLSVTAISSPSSSPLPVQQSSSNLLNKLNSPTINSSSPPQPVGTGNNAVLTSPVVNKRRPSISSSSSVGSPMKQSNAATFKRSKSNLANVEPLGPPPPIDKAANKKRRKQTTPDTTINSSADNGIVSHKNASMNDDTLTHNSNRSCITKEKMYFLSEKKRGLNEKNFKHLRTYLIRKKRFLVRMNKLKHSNLINFINKGRLNKS
jgi:hypothetical protein